MRLILTLWLVSCALSFLAPKRAELPSADAVPSGRSGGGFGVRTPQPKHDRAARSLAMRRTWFDGRNEHEVFVNPERVLVFARDADHPRHAPRPGAALVSRRAGMAVWSVPPLAATDLAELDRGGRDDARVCVCVHAGADTATQPLGLPGGLFVRAAAGVETSSLLATLDALGYGRVRVTHYDARLVYVETEPGLGVLDAVSDLARLESVAEARPNWWRGGRR